MNRRELLMLSGAATVAAGIPSVTLAQAAPKQLRIGYQKSGVLAIAKQQKQIETRLQPQDISVKWIEFPFGPPLLEALSAGSLDYGYTGDAPPVFAQAAHANLLYVASLPARGDNQAIVVLPDSPLQSLQDLKGKKLGFAKASSAHNLAVAALESAGLTYADVNPVYLAPADAASAFARGAIDAWSIWDPFLAIVELSSKARRLPISPEAARQNSFFLAHRDFTAKYPQIVAAVNDELAIATRWAKTHHDEAAKLFSEATGVNIDAQKRAVDRSEFDLSPLTEQIVHEQQAVADRFYRIKLIPNPVVVSDIVWKWTPAG